MLPVHFYGRVEETKEGSKWVDTQVLITWGKKILQIVDPSPAKWLEVSCRECLQQRSKWEKIDKTLMKMRAILREVFKKEGKCYKMTLKELKYQIRCKICTTVDFVACCISCIISSHGADWWKRHILFFFLMEFPLTSYLVFVNNSPITWVTFYPQTCSPSFFTLLQLAGGAGDAIRHAHPWVHEQHREHNEAVVSPRAQWLQPEGLWVPKTLLSRLRTLCWLPWPFLFETSWLENKGWRRGSM